MEDFNMNDHTINTCKICGSVNVTKYKNISNYNICYYCYVVKNNNLNNKIIINNDLFLEICKEQALDLSKQKNIISINYPDINKLSENIYNYNILDDNFKVINQSLQYGKIDSIIIPNIENIDFHKLLKESSGYLTNNVNLYIGFYSSIRHFQDLDIINNIQYIYNAYAISKVLSQNNLNIYINNFWEKDDYILFQINKTHNPRTERNLQVAFDNMFYSNFKKEVNL